MRRASFPRCAGPASGALLATAFAGACEAELLTQLRCPSALIRAPMSHSCHEPIQHPKESGIL